MKKLLALILCAVATPAFALDINENSPVEQQIGYSYGYVLASSQTSISPEYHAEAVTEGLNDIKQGKASRLSKEQMLLLLLQHRKELDSKPLKEMQQQAVTNAKSSQKFLMENARKVGIKTTKTGLQFKVLRASLALGKQYPTSNSKVKVHYEGRSIDGVVFDSSMARDEPVVLEMKHLIAGLQEGLSMMKPSQKARFFIPAELAYGSIGSGTSIQPNQTVIFDIELLEVLP